MTWNAPSDLACLAKWLPHLLGRAICVEPRAGSSAPVDGRPDDVDERSRDFRRACHALCVMESLYRANADAAFVLWSTYVHHAGSPRNAHWNRILALRLMTDAERFASIERGGLAGRGAEAWRLDGMGRSHIQRAIQQAEEATPVLSSGVWVSAMSERCSRAEEDVRKTEALVVAWRQQQRAEQAERRQYPSRKAWRAAKNGGG